MKIAVILFNLGGPDKQESIEPFLMNFFMDKNIIGAPKPIRWMLAKLISKRRSKREAGESYGFLGDKSPLLENTEKQSAALEKELNRDTGENEYKTFVCMSYWHPMAQKIVDEVQKWDADKAILLPLYPQYSTTTTKTAFEKWDAETKKKKLLLPTVKIGCYPFESGFINSSAQKIKAKIKDKKNTRILFSAHGLPEKIIEKGDPYQWQCEQSAQKIVKAVCVENLDWQICYQSRVGPLKWIGPSIEEALKKAARDNVSVVIYPHAFTQEHVETLVELGIEYKEEAQNLGIPNYDVVETVGTDSLFINGLATVVKENQRKASTDADTLSATGHRECPQQFEKCPCA